MTLKPRQRRHHFKNSTPSDPAITPFADWPIPNRSFHHSFYCWLKAGGYCPAALNTYSVAARLALGYLNKIHWEIKPEEDLERVREYIKARYSSSSTPREYNKGLLKLEEYLLLRKNKVARAPIINWEHYLKGLPDWLCSHVRDFIAHKRKEYRPEDHHRNALTTLSKLCHTLRQMAGNITLDDISDITPKLWFDYVDTRLAEGIHTKTINGHLSQLKAFLLFLNESGLPVCQRVLLLEYQKTGPDIPKDVPIS
ncbi:MAG: hypothetical protein K8R91_00570 [Phycisphaerae bacterium]|nr:hypothetical protein [Phycisphaerae bacterium]